jgi:hypothetical protein
MHTLQNTHLKVTMVVSASRCAHHFQLQMPRNPRYSASLCHVWLRAGKRRPTTPRAAAAATCHGQRQLPHWLHEHLRDAAVGPMRLGRRQQLLLLPLLQGQRRLLLLLMILEVAAVC